MLFELLKRGYESENSQEPQSVLMFIAQIIGTAPKQVWELDSDQQDKLLIRVLTDLIKENELCTNQNSSAPGELLNALTVDL